MYDIRDIGQANKTELFSALEEQHTRKGLWEKEYCNIWRIQLHHLAATLNVF